MSFILSRRRVALACLLLVAAVGVIVMRSLPGADAQQLPGTQTFISSGILVTATNGHATLESGTNDGILGIACTGNAPRGGTARIPAMVVTELTVNDTRLRIVQANGVTVTGTVRINCVVEIPVTPRGAAIADQFRAAAN